MLKQAFADSFGDDFIVLDIDSYVSSLSKEIYSIKRQSFAIAGRGADYGDPQNYLGQETDDSDNAYYMVQLGHAVDSESAVSYTHLCTKRPVFRSSPLEQGTLKLQPKQLKKR